MILLSSPEPLIRNMSRIWSLLHDSCLPLTIDLAKTFVGICKRSGRRNNPFFVLRSYVSQPFLPFKKGGTLEDSAEPSLCASCRAMHGKIKKRYMARGE